MSFEFDSMSRAGISVDWSQKILHDRNACVQTLEDHKDSRNAVNLSSENTRLKIVYAKMSALIGKFSGHIISGSSVLEAPAEWKAIFSEQKCLSGIWQAEGDVWQAHQWIGSSQLFRLLFSEMTERCDTCSILINSIYCLYSNTDTCIDYVTGWRSGKSIFVIGIQDSDEPEDVEIFVAEENTAIPNTTSRLDIGARRISSGDTSSEDSLEWSRRWLEFCTKSHERCIAEEDASLPSRVIDLAPDGQMEHFEAVKLVDGAIHLPPARYAALSHCWGQALPDCTTKATIGNRKRLIPYTSLPKTFRDAVDFTRGLQIRYLWIDSLCIVQDDEIDWRRESAQLEKVYGNSYVTLASVYAKDCNGGLFTTLPQRFISHSIGQIDWNGKLLKIFARRSLPYMHSWHEKSGNNKCPLFGRGWAYQERLIAPRVIYFTEYELLWGCFECVGCECLGDAPNGNRDPNNPKIIHRNELERGEAKERWLKIVEEFSTMELTKPQDKLPAISAIAKQIQQYRPGDKYLAGLWYHTILEDLLWVRNDRVRPPTLRSPGYIAPTWSWASISDGVDHPKMSLVDDDPIRQPQILFAHCQCRENDEYGQVTSGALVIRGKLAKCSINISKSPITLTHPAVRQVEFTTDPTIYHTFYQDCIWEPGDDVQESDYQMRTVYLLNIFERKRVLCCLVLVKLFDRDVYNRVGLTITCIPSSWPIDIVREKKKLVDIFSTVRKSNIIIE